MRVIKNMGIKKTINFNLIIKKIIEKMKYDENRTKQQTIIL